MPSIKRHVLSHSGAAIFGGVAQLGVITIIAAQFGPVAFGQLALFMSASQVFTLITTLNLAGYSISIASLHKRLRFAATLVTGSFMVSALAFVGFILFHLLPGQEFTDPWLLLPIYVLLQALSTIAFSLHIASARTPQAAISYIARPISLLFLTSTLSLISKDLWVLMVGIVLAEFSATTLLFRTLPAREKRLATRLNLKDWYEESRKEYKFYLSAGFGAYLSNLAASLPNILGGYLLPPQLFGSFALAQRLAQAPISMIGAPICAIANRTARQMRETGQAIDNFTQRVFVGALAAAVGIFFLMWFSLTLGQAFLPTEWNGLLETAGFVFAAAAFQFATSTIGFTPLLLRRIKFLITWSGIRVASLSAVALYIYATDGSALYFLLGYSTSEILMSLVFFIFSGRSKTAEVKA